MSQFHPDLEELFRRHLGSTDAIPEKMRPLFEAISLHYGHHQRELELTEQSVHLNCQSLTEKAERLERSNEELKRFAFVAAHDLREPLRSISGFIQLLERREGVSMSEQGREYMEFAVSGVRQLDSLLEGLLAYSRIEGAEQSNQPLKMGELLDEVVLTLNSKISETQGSIRYSNLPSVQGDRHQLRRLFQNLLENSLKFRSEATPLVSIRAESDTPGFYRFSITDNGIGVPPEFRKGVFAVFKRLHAREDYEGSGIGLAICKKIVERHGGEIWIGGDGEEPDVPQQEGSGLTIHLTLPAAPLGAMASEPFSEDSIFSDPVPGSSELDEAPVLEAPEITPESIEPATTTTSKNTTFRVQKIDFVKPLELSSADSPGSRQGHKPENEAEDESDDEQEEAPKNASTASEAEFRPFGSSDKPSLTRELKRQLKSQRVAPRPERTDSSPRDKMPQRLWE